MCVDTRSQHKNKEIAFLRMYRSEKFQKWHKIECSRRLGQPTIEEIVDREMQNIKVEYY